MLADALPTLTACLLGGGGERNDLDHYDRDRSHDGKGAEPREQALPPSYPATASTASLA